MELESLLPSFEPIIALQKQIQKRKDQVVALRTLNEEKTKEAQTIGKSLFEIRKHWNPILRKLDVSLTTSKVKYVSLKKKVDNLQSEVDGLKHFMDAVGLKTAINDEDDETENLKYFSIQYHKIFYNGQNCKLYFSVLDLPGPFSVMAAYPPFPEFKDLAAETNASQNFTKLVVKAREYFIREAHRSSSIVT